MLAWSVPTVHDCSARCVHGIGPAGGPAPCSCYCRPLLARSVMPCHNMHPKPAGIATCSLLVLPVLLQLEAEKAKLSVVTGMHVYSVQPGVPKASEGGGPGGGEGRGGGDGMAVMDMPGLGGRRRLCSAHSVPADPQLVQNNDVYMNKHDELLNIHEIACDPASTICFPPPQLHPSPALLRRRAPAPPCRTREIFTTQTMHRPWICSGSCWPPRRVRWG